MEDLKPFGDVLSKLITALEFVAWVLRRLVWLLRDTLHLDSPLIILLFLIGIVLAFGVGFLAATVARWLS